MNGNMNELFLHVSSHWRSRASQTVRIHGDSDGEVVDDHYTKEKITLLACI